MRFRMVAGIGFLLVFVMLFSQANAKPVQVYDGNKGSCVMSFGSTPEVAWADNTPDQVTFTIDAASLVGKDGGLNTPALSFGTNTKFTIQYKDSSYTFPVPNVFTNRVSARYVMDNFIKNIQQLNDQSVLAFIPELQGYFSVEGLQAALPIFQRCVTQKAAAAAATPLVQSASRLSNESQKTQNEALVSDQGDYTSDDLKLQILTNGFGVQTLYILNKSSSDPIGVRSITINKRKNPECNIALNQALALGDKVNLYSTIFPQCGNEIVTVSVDLGEKGVFDYSFSD